MMPPKVPAKPRAKKVNGYARPAAVKQGFLLTDTRKQSWLVGKSIGSGGFGDIYSCCSAASPTKKLDDYPHVVKIEPHGNGPLFVEMHFYARNCKKEDIDNYRVSKGWKHLGMPVLISHGSQDIGGERQRFLVIPRYGTDLWKLFLDNNRRLPQHTVYRIGIQMLNVLEYMHSRGYVHADIKGANILLGTGKSGAEQCYLVDFGLANHFSTKEYKPDPKNAHNGTIEYTSRDAHQGVSTMRGDLEVLGLNLVHWSGLDLPWESQKLLADPKKVQAAKEAYMKGLDKQLSGAPEAVKSFMKYVERMQHDESPDYDKCRGYLEKGLKQLGKADKGALEFGKTATTATKTNTPTPRKRARNSSTSPPPGILVPYPTPGRRRTPSAGPSKKMTPPAKSSSTSTPPSAVSKETPRKRKLNSSSPVKQQKGRKEKEVSSKDDLSVIILDSPSTDNNNGPTPLAEQEEARQKAKERRKGGHLTVNNDITPKTTATTSKKAKKTYEFNFEVDVSFDADVVVNVKRKKKDPATSRVSGKSSTPLATAAARKRPAESPSTPAGISPVVRKRIARNVKVTPGGSVRVEKG